MPLNKKEVVERLESLGEYEFLTLDRKSYPESWDIFHELEKEGVAKGELVQLDEQCSEFRITLVK